jgi:hypothetical protein
MAVGTGRGSERDRESGSQRESAREIERATRREKAQRFLASRRAVVWIVALGVLLTAPSLAAGLALDDYLFDIVLRRLPMVVAQTGPLDLFRFADGNPHTARAMMDIGEIAWTSDLATRGAFLRPISALTHVVDYALWPGSPALMHAQSILWFALAIGGAAAAYRRLLGPTWVSGLALLLFAIDDTHGSAVAWIANRNALVALALALPILTLHDRWRREGWKPGAWLGPALLACALLAGESALAIVAYLAAYALHVDRAAWRSRVVSLAPHAAIVVAWRLAYSFGGYGVSGSSIYVDPGRHPGAFLASVPRRLPFLLAGELALPRSDLAELYEFISPSAKACMLAFAIVVLVLLAAAMARLWRNDPVARFFASGLLLASIPICATAPGDRLLVFVSFGAMGLVAQLLASAVGRASAFDRASVPGRASAPGRERIAAAFLFLAHVVFAPLALTLKCASVPFGVPNEITDRFIPKTPDVASKTVLLVDPPGELFGMVLIASRIVRGEPHPARLRSLAPVSTAIRATRVDARSLLLRPAHGFLEHVVERGWRTPERPLLAGSVVEMPGLTVTVTESTSDGRPAEALFRFEVPLEDASLLWLAWDHGGFAPWVPPPIGETTTLPAKGLFDLAMDTTKAKASRREVEPTAPAR